MARPDPQAAEQAGAMRERTLQAQIDQLTLTSARRDASGAADASLLRAPRSFHRILACVSGAPSSEHVIAWTREIARLFGAEVTIFHATDVAPDLALYPGLGPIGIGAPIMLPEETKDIERRADQALAQAKTRLEQDVPNVATLRREGHAGHEIVRTAREIACDLIVMGTHDGGPIDRAILGSTSDHVKNHAETNVLLARTAPTPGRVVCAVDGSAPSRHAASLADAIAQRWHEPLELVYVAPKRWHTAYEDVTAEGLRARAHAGLAGEPAAAHLTLEFGKARDVITQRLRDAPPSLLAVGARGMSGLRSLVAGSVSTHLARESPTSVLIARGV